MTRQRTAIAALIASIAILYLYNLDGFGIFGPDEPRYAAIGRAMVQTGDFITPRLWGKPWFEKPPLLYWMTAVGTTLGLGPELCCRLPVVVLSLLFLVISFIFLKHEFDGRAALASVALLATSAGWLAFSSVAVTDLPLSVFFSFAVLLALPLLRREPETSRTSLILAGIGSCIGLAALAKGLVPIVLTLPFAWFLRRYWRKWWFAILAFLITAMPWYVTVYARNGYPFIEDFFIKQQVQRIYSASLLHVQPPYYYLPVFLGAIFPWTPFLTLFIKRQQSWDRRHSFLLSVVGFGLVFFSISLNKLPGYLLPLLPSFFILLGLQFEKFRTLSVSRVLLLSSAVLIAMIPLFASVLTSSLAVGKISRGELTHMTGIQMLYAAVPLLVGMLPARFFPGLLLVVCMAVEGVFLKTMAYPVIDTQVSARGFWGAVSRLAFQTCDGGTDRDWLYGLNYYRGKAYPSCDSGKFAYVLRSRGRKMPEVVPIR